MNSLAPAMTETPLFGVLTQDVLDRAIAATPHGQPQRQPLCVWIGCDRHGHPLPEPQAVAIVIHTTSGYLPDTAGTQPGAVV